MTAIVHSFRDDYSEGAHPRVLERLARTNLEQHDSYGEDALCMHAAALLREATGNPGAAVHFVAGGTQANLVALSAMLRPTESVIAAQAAHIEVHEAGAIEATGHKIHALPARDGKLDPKDVRALVATHGNEHMVLPRVVFVSQATEAGTVYRKAELQALSQACRELGLYLYLDGARLAQALASDACDLSLRELSSLVDVFYLGGTKNGALLGEAVVINTPRLQDGFRRHLKQRGALLAKGRLLGAQFAALLEDGLYLELARHANAMAARLAAGLRGLDVPLLAPAQTNQVFPILPDAQVAALASHYHFHHWECHDQGHAAIRLVCSWATPPAAVDGLLATLRELRTG